ncbi:MAG: transposase [Hyphomonadaceae bacterium]
MSEELLRLESGIAMLEVKLRGFHRRNQASVCLAGIPAVGPVGAFMLVLKTRDPKSFKSGRVCAAWLVLTPKGRSTAGKQKLGGTTRAGDERL